MGRDMKKRFYPTPVCMEALPPTSLGPHFPSNLKFFQMYMTPLWKESKNGNLNLYTLEVDIWFTKICDHSSVKIPNYFRMMIFNLGGGAWKKRGTKGPLEKLMKTIAPPPKKKSPRADILIVLHTLLAVTMVHQRFSG